MRQLKITQSITNRASAAVDKYLTDVSKYSLITAEEEKNLAVLIRQGDKKALHTLVTANLRFVVSVAKQHQKAGLELSDLINDGNLGLIKAANRFDETRGFKFISYAVWWIRQSIMEGISNNGRMVRLPLNKVGLANKYQTTYTKLEQQLERAPQQEEVLDLMGIDKLDVQEMMACIGKHLSIDKSVSEDDNNTTFSDRMIEKDALATDDSLIKESLHIDTERIFRHITEKEVDVLKMFFGIGIEHPATLEEIGKKYDLTRERVRQIKEKAIRRLKIKSRKSTLRKYL